HPNIHPIKSHSSGILPYSKCPQDGPVTGPEFGHSVISNIRHPNTSPVKCYPLGALPYGKSSQRGSIASPEFGHSVATKICYPDTGPIKRYPSGVLTYGKAHGLVRLGLVGLIPAEKSYLEWIKPNTRGAFRSGWPYWSLHALWPLDSYRSLRPRLIPTCHRIPCLTSRMGPFILVVKQSGVGIHTGIEDYW